jgi:hypothetical protein
MNSTTRTRRRSSRNPKVALKPELIWHHLGRGHRVTLWPEIAFEKEMAPGLWLPFTPDPRGEVFSAGAVMIDRRRWQAYLELCPRDWQEFVDQFTHYRLQALTALAYCPALHEDMEERPILALFAASHAELRGTAPEWSELNAVRQHGTIFDVLGWLGLPATREALSQLDTLSLDLPLRDLRRVREILWQQHEARVRGEVTGPVFNPLAA